MTLNEASDFWQKGSLKDLKVADDLFNLGHFQWCLFLYHLAIEKILKAKIATFGKEIPYTHNLNRLAKVGDLRLSDSQIKQLNEITTFNLEARYDDYKLAFYQKATHEYSQKWSQACKDLHLWIKSQIN